MTEAGFTSRQAAAVTGLSLRQLSYWRRTGLISPARRTKGGHARYSFSDLIVLKTAWRLLDAGIPLQRVRCCLSSLNRLLPSFRTPLTEIAVVAIDDVVLVLQKGAVFDSDTGQGWFLPVAELARDLEALRRGGPPVQGELVFDAGAAVPAKPELRSAAKGR